MIHQLTAFALTFSSVFIKGFQHKNVIGGHHKLIFITSYAMAITDVLMIGLVVERGWSICFSAGTGAAIGMSLSMFVHDKMTKRLESSVRSKNDTSRNNRQDC